MSAVCNFDTALTKCTNKVTFDIDCGRQTVCHFALIWQNVPARWRLTLTTSDCMQFLQWFDKNTPTMRRFTLRTSDCMQFLHWFDKNTPTRRRFTLWTSDCMQYFHWFDKNTPTRWRLTLRTSDCMQFWHWFDKNAHLILMLDCIGDVWHWCCQIVCNFVTDWPKCAFDNVKFRLSWHWYPACETHGTRYADNLLLFQIICR